MRTGRSGRRAPKSCVPFSRKTDSGKRVASTSLGFERRRKSGRDVCPRPYAPRLFPERSETILRRRSVRTPPCPTVPRRRLLARLPLSGTTFSSSGILRRPEILSRLPPDSIYSSDDERRRRYGLRRLHNIFQVTYRRRGVQKPPESIMFKDGDVDGEQCMIFNSQNILMFLSHD